ncbi:hypothetical protein ACWGPQ_15095 [Saccharomonospora azurea]
MTQDMVNEHNGHTGRAESDTTAPQSEPTEEKTVPGGTAPLPPTGWDPYSPPVRPVYPSGWDPYLPPTRPQPMGWDPYRPPFDAPRPFGGSGVAGAEPVPPVSPAPSPAPTPGPGGEDRQSASPGGWVHGAAITHLWAATKSEGVWVAVHGVGWRQLSSASESGHGHLATLALLAKNHRLPVAYHEDSRGHIDQLLV